LLLYFLPPHGYLLPHGYAGPGLPAVGATFFHQQGELEIFIRKFMPSSRARGNPRGCGPALTSIRFFAIEGR